ncbi:MAG: hypothetical protein SFT91_02810 [Rickettsiaceae bacterium]|nr:hypothetical protein [Rickettsiaceae bacterium]
MENNHPINNNRINNNIIGSVFAPYLFLIAGLVLGYMICSFSATSTRNIKYKIAYISQKEILDLENKRITNLKQSKELAAENQQLFFGHHKEAIDLIEKEAGILSQKMPDLKIIFSNDQVYGSDVYSISKQIWRKVIKILASKDIAVRQTLKQEELEDEDK